jgi:pyruvate/2-oxoacid:ferredoxin oxidoreductase beta subunit
MKKGNIGIGINNPSHQIHIKCPGCGQESYIDTLFEINIIGALQFRCNSCQSVTSTSGIWPNTIFRTSPSEKLIITDGSVGI